MSSQAMKRIEDYKRKEMRTLLLQCTEGQVNLFNRMYGSVDTIPESKMSWAFEQIEATIKKNNSTPKKD